LSLAGAIKQSAFRFADATLEYSEANKPGSYRDDKCRMPKIQEKFGNWLAEKITPQDIEAWLASKTEWAEATKNRYLSLMKLAYRLAELNGKVRTNPARLVRMHRENNARVRYLNQFKPLPATEDYLKARKTEEARLPAFIEKDYPQHLGELDIALNTGLRRNEQYGLQWKDVNFERKMLTIPRAKNGETRHVPLNAPALAAFKKLLPGMGKNNYVFLSERREKALQNSRHWFEDAVEKAGVRDFTWHCLRSRVVS
jgi:integrase